MLGTHELIVQGFLLFYQLSYGLVPSLDLLSENSLEFDVLVLEDADGVLGAVKFIGGTHAAIIQCSSFLLAGFI